MNWLGYGTEEATPQLSSEDAKKALAENGDDFKDALEDDAIDTGKTFAVSAEELTIIRKELETQFPDDCTYLSDAYILSVASKPYSKDPTKRRPLEVRLVSGVVEGFAKFPSICFSDDFLFLICFYLLMFITYH